MKNSDDDLELVPAIPTDAAKLADLRVLAMRESLERIGRFDPDRACARFSSTFSSGNTRHIEITGCRVGFVVLISQPTHLLLDHLYIQPENQNAGIGAAVLRRLFAEADELGSSMRVGALRESASNRFYLKHGFELVEKAEWDNYYVRPARCWSRS